MSYYTKDNPPAIGSVIRVMPGGKSSMSINHAEEIFTVKDYETYGGGYIKTNHPNCRGIWLNEIEPYCDLTYELVDV